MQITRFRRDGQDQVGVIENGTMRETRGDICEIEIEGLGVLSNTCVAEDALPA